MLKGHWANEANLFSGRFHASWCRPKSTHIFIGVYVDLVTFPFSAQDTTHSFLLEGDAKVRGKVSQGSFSSVQCNRKMETAKASQSSFPSVVSNISHSSREFHDRLERSNQGSSVSPDKKTSAEL